MKTYLKLIALVAVFGVSFISTSAQAAGKGAQNSNAHGMNPHANPRAALGGMNASDRAAEARARHDESMSRRDAAKGNNRPPKDDESDPPV